MAPKANLAPAGLLATPSQEVVVTIQPTTRNPGAGRPAQSGKCATRHNTARGAETLRLSLRHAYLGLVGVGKKLGGLSICYQNSSLVPMALASLPDLRPDNKYYARPPPDTPFTSTLIGTALSNLAECRAARCGRGVISRESRRVLALPHCSILPANYLTHTWKLCNNVNKGY